MRNNMIKQCAKKSCQVPLGGKGSKGLGLGTCYSSMCIIAEKHAKKFPRIIEG
jgi:hypothetical protein